MSTIRNWVAEFNEEALLADGFEEAVIGIAERCSKPPLVIYDAKKCIDILMERDGMDFEEAFEVHGLGEGVFHDFAD